MTLVIGHKGAPTTAPENRVASFAAAREQGADGVELDVRRAQDGYLAVWHDPSLPSGQVLLDTPWSALSQHVDQLNAVLDAVSGMELVNIEIKNWPADADFDPTYEIADAVCDVLAGRDQREWGSFVVSCFHPETLARARERLDVIAPQIATGQLLWIVPDPETLAAEVAKAGHAAMHPHHTGVTPGLVDAAHAAGLTVNTWTCNEPDRIRWLADIGTNGIITDEPAAARQALS